MVITMPEAVVVLRMLMGALPLLLVPVVLVVVVEAPERIPQVQHFSLLPVT
jgi:hypothetical protein